MLLACALALTTARAARARPSAALPWFVSGARAAKLIAAGAQLLDARAAATRRRDALPGATAVDWRALSQRGVRGGLLLALPALTRRLRALGVRRGGTVLVLGDPRGGWGEDGRVAWTLRAVGHRRAAIVDGGVAALRRAGVRRVAAAAVPGDFTARGPLRYRASMARVAALLHGHGAVFIDARERREYDGAHPYGERRGGHLPGAVHLYFKRLLDARGRLVAPALLRARLARLGVTPSTIAISYCSGGVRSAWLTAALQHAGYRRAENYAGSMWQWSAQPARTHPLVKAAKR